MCRYSQCRAFFSSSLSYMAALCNVYRVLWYLLQSEIKLFEHQQVLGMGLGSSQGLLAQQDSSLHPSYLQGRWLLSIGVFQCDAHACGWKNRGECSAGVCTGRLHMCPEVIPAVKAVWIVRQVCIAAPHIMPVPHAVGVFPMKLVKHVYKHHKELKSKNQNSWEKKNSTFHFFALLF